MIRVICENRTLQAILLGIVISAVVIGAVCVIFSERPVYSLVGLGIGMLGAAFMGIHMAYTIEDAVLLSENDATAYIRKMTYIRYGVACVLVILTGVTGIGNPVLCVIGLLLLKAGAYLTPTINKILSSKNNKEGGE